MLAALKKQQKVNKLKKQLVHAEQIESNLKLTERQRQNNKQGNQHNK